jgi:hypothetical protein
MNPSPATEASPAAMAEQRRRLWWVRALECEKVYVREQKGRQELLHGLSKVRGRKGKRKGTGRPASLPLMAGGSSGRNAGKGMGENDRGLKVGDLLP